MHSLNNPQHKITWKINRIVPSLQVVTSRTPYTCTRRLTKRVTAFQYAFTRGEIISGRLLQLWADWSTIAPCTFFFYNVLTFRWVRAAEYGTTFRDFSLASLITSVVGQGQHAAVVKTNAIPLRRENNIWRHIIPTPLYISETRHVTRRSVKVCSRDLCLISNEEWG